MSGFPQKFVARPVFPKKLLAYIDGKCLQKRLKYNYRISFSPKIDLKIETPK